MKKNIVIVCCTLIGLSGCSKKDNDSNDNSKQVPASLSFQKPTPGQALTPAQASEIKTLFAGKAMMVLPPGELIFPQKGMSSTEKETKESALYSQDRNSYAMLKEIQAGCNTSRPTTKIDATFPTDGNGSIENLKVNDHIAYSTDVSLNGSKNGAVCPVDTSAAFGLGANVEKVDPNQKSLQAVANSNFKARALVNNPRYAQLLNTRGIIVDSSVTGLGLVRQAQGDYVLTYSLSGSYLTLQSEIPYTSEVKFLSHVKSASDVVSETVVKADLRLPNFNVNIVTHSVQQSEMAAVSEVYLNGHLTSTEELNRLFGANSPALASHRNLAEKLK